MVCPGEGPLSSGLEGVQMTSSQGLWLEQGALTGSTRQAMIRGLPGIKVFSVHLKLVVMNPELSRNE